MAHATSAQVSAAPVHAATSRVGDWVRVKSREEILATLDSQGRVDGLPFMPEMLAFAGRCFPVDAVTHRTCDTVKTSGTSGTTRRMERAVHLQGVRCDGSAHSGCQARCLLFWKEDWLEIAAAEPLASRADEAALTLVDDVPLFLQEATRGQRNTAEVPVYSCQATEMLNATRFVSVRNPAIWIKDMRSRNATLSTAIIGLAVLMFNKLQGASASARLPRWLRIGGRAWPSLRPTGERRSFPALDLQPGELVEVRSREEIEATLDEGDRLRGLRFGVEMLPYCGRQARVLARVDRIIDEQTGRMLRLRDCILLEDVWCQGTFRALCRRKIYTYWREAWLRRADSTGS